MLDRRRWPARKVAAHRGIDRGSCALFVAAFSLAVALVGAAAAYAFSLLIGLDVIFTTALLVLVGLVTFSLHRWSGERDVANGHLRFVPLVVEAGAGR